ncbi:MAG: leucyl/phenylalanyl-tRNA--protein transferase [Ilumatobacter sp.]|uniref:leucyl/phenylalanyl-tRNA--protein transferase n=1 Tax=Ilumatobacter sp. TaxID=1967498 RepID=UPI00260A7DDF|nr:leucyl/phenylalanyl-tRNA--protein transferase [Ilumatobacter sp.]MDJ0770421.1 leucyl/phenylalanyl-tRNA--protein transferase [Ilumatobacter sp.]
MSERAGAERFDHLPATPLITPIEPPPSRWTMPTVGPIDDSDIVALGADLEPGTLLTAYRTGLFPMPFDRRRIAWFSPDPRGVLPLDGLRVSRSLRRSVRRYGVRMDTRFREVMSACAAPDRSGGWINRAFIDAYTRLHELGWAHSIEIYARSDGTGGDLDGSDADGELVGGLYGVRIGGFFAGESMFHRATDASKVALVHVVDWLHQTDGRLLDVQWTTPHLASLGAVDISRHEYLRRLADAL